MQENTTPDAATVEGHGERIAESDGTTTINITVTQGDPELQAMEAILVILQLQTYDTRVRILRYVAERIGIGAELWRDPALNMPEASNLTTAEVAQVLAQADGHDWAVMSDVQQSPYYRRAAALTGSSYAVVRLDS